MRILFTNNTLAHRGGSELAVLDLAARLKRKGHRPVAYSQDLGEVARELMQGGIPVIADLDVLQERPDIIHGHHHLETMAACLRFPDVPAIYVCHGWLPWVELPPTFATIMAYVGVGDVTRERIVTSVRLAGRPALVVPTFFDEERFQPKETIAARPRRALVYNNALTPQHQLVKNIAAACRKHNISLDLRGVALGMATNRPDALLHGYDLVFAVGRSAIEAMACGCAVIVCDDSGVARMAKPGDIADDGHNILNIYERSRERNSQACLGAEIDRYDPSDIALLRDEVRSRRSLSAALARFEDIYANAIQRFADLGPIDPRHLLGEASGYLRWLADVLKARRPAPRES